MTPEEIQAEKLERILNKLKTAELLVINAAEDLTEIADTDPEYKDAVPIADIIINSLKLFKKGLTITINKDTPR